MCHRGQWPFFLYPTILHPLEKKSSFQGRSNGAFSLTKAPVTMAQKHLQTGNMCLLLTLHPTLGYRPYIPENVVPLSIHGTKRTSPNSWLLKWKAGVCDDSDDGGVVWSCDGGCSAFPFLKPRKLCWAEKKSWLLVATLGGVERNHSHFLLERNTLTNDTGVSPSHFLVGDESWERIKDNGHPEPALKSAHQRDNRLPQSKVP